RHRSAIAGSDPDILLAILFPGDRWGDDPGPGLELPQFLAVPRIKRLEIAITGTGEDQIPRGCQYTSPQRQRFLVFPLDLAGGRVHRPKDADVVVIQALDAETHAQVGGALVVADF